MHLTIRLANPLRELLVVVHNLLKSLKDSEQLLEKYDLSFFLPHLWKVSRMIKTASASIATETSSQIEMAISFTGTIWIRIRLLHSVSIINFHLPKSI